MIIGNSDFSWPDPDLYSPGPVFTFPGEVSDEEMCRDTFPGFSDRARWMMALRDLKNLIEKRQAEEKAPCRLYDREQIARYFRDELEGDEWIKISKHIDCCQKCFRILLSMYRLP